MFLGWYDDSKKKSVSEKLEEAIQHYTMKFGEVPNTCLLNEADAVEYAGLEIKVASYVQPNHYWLGRDESVSLPVAA